MKKILIVGIFILMSSFYNTDPIVEKILTKENLWIEILKVKIKYPEIVFAQAMLESGNLKSTLCVKYNNLFGMKMPKKRATLAKNNTENVFASFKTWREAVLDYKLYQDNINIDKYKTEQSYLSYLDKHYAHMGNYSTKVKSIITKNKSILNCRVVELEVDTSARLADTEHEIGK